MQESILVEWMQESILVEWMQESIIVEWMAASINKIHEKTRNAKDFTD